MAEYIATEGTRFFYEKGINSVRLEKGGISILLPVNDILEFACKIHFLPFLETQEGKNTIKQISLSCIKELIKK